MFVVKRLKESLQKTRDATIEHAIGISMLFRIKPADFDNQSILENIPFRIKIC